MSIMSDMAPPPSQNGSTPPLIVESSQHFSINRLDLHICEESAQASAVQITLTEMSMDYYPARKAARSRKEFNPYTEAMMARDKWIESILQVGSYVFYDQGQSGLYEFLTQTQKYETQNMRLEEDFAQEC